MTDLVDNEISDSSKSVKDVINHTLTSKLDEYKKDKTY